MILQQCPKQNWVKKWRALDRVFLGLQLCNTVPDSIEHGFASYVLPGEQLVLCYELDFESRLAQRERCWNFTCQQYTSYIYYSKAWRFYVTPMHKEGLSE